jgi:hypothetical protein
VLVSYLYEYVFVQARTSRNLAQLQTRNMSRFCFGFTDVRMPTRHASGASLSPRAHEHVCSLVQICLSRPRLSVTHDSGQFSSDLIGEFTSHGSGISLTLCSSQLFRPRLQGEFHPSLACIMSQNHFLSAFLLLENSTQIRLVCEAITMNIA